MEKKYKYEDKTTLWIGKETVAKLKEIAKELEDKFKTSVDLERVIIELLDVYYENKKRKEMPIIV